MKSIEKVEWLERHKEADSIIFDEITKLPLKVVYDFPLGTFTRARLEDMNINDNEY